MTERRIFLKKLISGIIGLYIAPKLMGMPYTKNIIFPEKTNIMDISDNYREALYWEKTDRGIKCLLCPKQCIISDKQKGFCRVRYNINNKLYTVAYGNPCSMNIDPIEKKPLSHFHPSSRSFSLATAGCNLTCLNCQNWTISQSDPLSVRNYDLSPEQVVQETLKNNCHSISYTYTEPVTFYEYMLDTAKIAHSKGLKNVMITNGYINEEPMTELSKYIDAANVDLKAFDNDIYRRLTSGTLNPVLKTLEIMRDNDVWIEITNLIVPQWTDNISMIREMCKWLNDNGFSEYVLHFSRFTPLHKLSNLPPTPVKTLELARQTALEEGMKYVYIGNVPYHDSENTFCPNCKKLIVDRTGYKISKISIKNSKCEYCDFKIKGVWE